MNEATPAAPVTEAPVTPTAATPSVTTETVTLSKEAHDQLAKDAARARENQRKASLYDKIAGKGGSRFHAPVAPVAPSDDDREAAARAEDMKATQGLMRLASDPSFRDVLDSDPTLRSMLIENPLAVLPMLAPDALDADDAVSLVKEALAGRRKPATPAAKPDTPVTPKTPEVPPAGGVNTPDKPVNDALEAARKLPNTEHSIAGMLKARMGTGKK
jgi:hypothetical protein